MTYWNNLGLCMKNFMKSVCVLLSILGVYISANAKEEVCTYSDWEWDVEQQKAVNIREVTTTKDQLTPEQKHPDLPCSICEEDMAELDFENTAPFKVCRAVAPAVNDAMRQSINEGFRFNSVTGYRVGRTKGPLDENGLRTEYSNHSFGLAVDFNADANGLYNNCVTFGQNCELIRGGTWQPGNPASITRNSPIYRNMRAIGFRWGGDLDGRQKDFMHFSISGD